MCVGETPTRQPALRVSLRALRATPDEGVRGYKIKTASEIPAYGTGMFCFAYLHLWGWVR